MSTRHSTANFTWHQFEGSKPYNFVHPTLYPDKPLVKDNPASNIRTINDPRYGGLFAFGMVIARPTNPGTLPKNPADFWNEVWEFTSRTMPFTLPGEEAPSMIFTWEYEFAHNLNQLTCTLHATPRLRPDLWYKEPKFSFNGLLGYKSITVYNSQGRQLGTFDLTKYTNPVKKTLQIPYSDRFRYILKPKPPVGAKNTQFPSLTITFSQNDWRPWLEPAQAAPPLSQLAMKYDGTVTQAPKYCLTPQNKLKSQTEVPRWANGDICGVAMHGWEGGYGAPDCWNTFRPWPRVPISLRATVRFQ